MENQNKYEIEVEIRETEEIVTFWGEIPIQHMEKLTNAFVDLGFDRVIVGDQNSTLRLLKVKHYKYIPCDNLKITDSKKT